LFSGRPANSRPASGPRRRPGEFRPPLVAWPAAYPHSLALLETLERDSHPKPAPFVKQSDRDGHRRWRRRPSEPRGERAARGGSDTLRIGLIVAAGRGPARGEGRCTADRTPGSWASADAFQDQIDSSFFFCLLTQGATYGLAKQSRCQGVASTSASTHTRDRDLDQQ